MKITVENNNALHASIECDIIITDPPFDMPGVMLAEILGRQKSNHLVLITTMRQLLEFNSASEWELSFDCVLDHVVPKKSKSIHQPNYTHSTCVYMTRGDEKSRFNRKRRERSDTYDGNGYWPTILRAPRDRMSTLGQSKNIQAITDILGSFDIESVGDVFAGSGTTALAAFELDIDCSLVEIDSERCEMITKQFQFLGTEVSRS